MNTVSFETAKRLKEAGFPQPDPEFGQFWYHNAGSQIAIMESNDAGGHIGKFIRFFGTVNGSLREKSFFFSFNFCPDRNRHFERNPVRFIIIRGLRNPV